MVCTASLEAGTGEIHSSEFKFSDVIVYADTFETNHKMSARVIKTEDWYSGISGEGSAKVDSKVINLYLESSHYYENSYQLVRKAQQEKREPTDKEVEEAEQKDEEYKKQAEKNMIAELKRVGLALDPKTQTAVFFHSGNAKMKVIECLKGGFKKDDVISVTWKNVLDKVTCPHMIPFKGKCGWWLNRDKGNKNIYVLGGGFLSLDQAKEQKAKFEKAQMEKNEKKGKE